MKQNADGTNETGCSSKKRKTNKQMKPTLPTNYNRPRKTNMKPVLVNQKKKETKINIESSTRDTIAETIAFVIKGQLTPIKPISLPSNKPAKAINKRLQITRCKSKQNESKNEKNSLGKLSAKGNPKAVPTKRTTAIKTDHPILQKSKIPPKTITIEELDNSVNKILSRYTKKLNVKGNTRPNENKPNKKLTKVSKIIKPKNKKRKTSMTLIETKNLVKPRKYVRKKKIIQNPNQDKETINDVSQTEKNNEPDKQELMEIKIKEEKMDVDYSSVGNINKEQENAITNEIKNEILEDDSKQKEVTKDSDKQKNTVVKNSRTKKINLIKKKPTVTKKLQNRLDDKRRAKLIQFWNSPKRHRVASLNALAKVHCLYENESKAAFEKMTENSLIKKETSLTENTQRKNITTILDSSDDDGNDDETDDELPVKRVLRDVPGLRGVGKLWDMHDSISSDNSDIEIRRFTPKKTVRVKKEVAKKSAEKPINKTVTTTVRRKPKPEIPMDLKDMVVKKRMASLNASAMLAASYSTDKKGKPSKFTDSSSDYDTDSSAEEYFAAIQQIDLTKDTKEDNIKQEDGNLIEVHTTPNKKVAVILNQDTDVTITGVYVNSTTRSTHHEGYCSIAGMQYRISATSHTQTAATAVATETLIQSSNSSDNAHLDAQSCSSKSYTPLDALSNMQPPPGPGIHNAPPSHAGMPCQIGSPQLRQRSSSAFSSPHHGHHGFHPVVPSSGQVGLSPSGDSPVGFVHGYYQPAGPLISVSHGHGQPPTVQQPPPIPKSVPLSDASPTSVSSTQPPPAPGSNNGDSSDNEVIITSVTTGTKEPPSALSHQPPASYRYPSYSQYHTYPCPPQYHYQTPPPPTPPYAHHDMCYPSPPGGYMRHTKYAPSATYHRYPYYPGHASELYPVTSAPPVQPSQQMVTASPVSGSGSYPSVSGGPPAPPAIMESYPPPPAPPTLVDPYQPAPQYYHTSAYGLPPTCYSHSPTRAIPYINTTYQHCPCPLNSCPKNGHTGPLTGESKRSNIHKDSKPLPPVALALPLEPVSATGPPSPARGSAGMPSGGMPPPPSPAGANYQPPATPKQESRSPEVCHIEKRKARVGKANVRNNMQNTMLLMCNPAQDYVKREIESPEGKEQINKNQDVFIEDLDVVKEDSKIPEACTENTCTKDSLNIDSKTTQCLEELEPTQTELMNCEQLTEPTINKPDFEKSVPPILKEPEEEPLPPCIATVAENVKVKNMKRKQSMSKEKVAEEIIPPPTKKKKITSYKDFIRKHTSCFKISNGKKKLVSKGAKAQLTKVKHKTSTKKTKEQTNNRRIKAVGKKTVIQKPSPQKKTINKPSPAKIAPKVLDNLIAKNHIDKVIEDVIQGSKKGEIEEKIKKPAPKTSKPIKILNNNTKTGASRRKSTTTSKCKIDIPEVPVKVTRKPTASVPKWSNGWMWEGEPYEGKVFINSDETTLVRKCYPSMRHREGDLIRPGDCVLLKAGPRKNDLPYVAKIAALWENSEDGEMMMSLLWYYRPEHTEQGRLMTDQPDEVFASRHKDSNSVACIDDKCYVVTYNEYCRYKKHFKRIQEGVEERPRCVPLPDPYPRIRKQPPSSSLSTDIVFFCRKVYDFRQKRIVKNPT
ncbi:unnamed protein product [Ceutorhynchus assimilis]|uniref:BAH domain-containing protein n=1 Tax=Ceutorhynchus assimilis TaxID=467358 RepID=A0A9P0DE85_9CUCU|nr:unnamed protein product [Ceutorhynchus assimilis]